jgi:hypothetical protein
MRFIFIFLFLIGCATVPQPQCPVCPGEDVIIISPAGPVKVLKGMMVPDNYYTIQEWNELVEAYKKTLSGSM